MAALVAERTADKTAMTSAQKKERERAGVIAGWGGDCRRRGRVVEGWQGWMWGRGVVWGMGVGVREWERDE